MPKIVDVGGNDVCRTGIGSNAVLPFSYPDR
jgi:hypothetical protein